MFKKIISILLICFCSLYGEKEYIIVDIKFINAKKESIKRSSIDLTLKSVKGKVFDKKLFKKDAHMISREFPGSKSEAILLDGKAWITFCIKSTCFKKTWFESIMKE